MRNHSQRRRKRASREGGDGAPSPGHRPRGAKKTEMNPASSSIPSDWYEEKSCAAATKERKSRVQMAQVPRGQTPTVNRTEATRPPATSAVSAPFELPSQRSEGTCQIAVSAGAGASEVNNTDAGRMPRGPMRP